MDKIVSVIFNIIAVSATLAMLGYIIKFVIRWRKNDSEWCWWGENNAHEFIQ